MAIFEAILDIYVLLFIILIIVLFIYFNYTKTNSIKLTPFQSAAAECPSIVNLGSYLSSPYINMAPCQSLNNGKFMMLVQPTNEMAVYNIQTGDKVWSSGHMSTTGQMSTTTISGATELSTMLSKTNVQMYPVLSIDTNNDSSVQFTATGNIKLTDALGNILWQTHSANCDTGISTLEMENDGTFIQRCNGLPVYKSQLNIAQSTVPNLNTTQPT